MTIIAQRLSDGTYHFLGTSGDSKPSSGVAAGSEFVESDTGYHFGFDGANWIDLTHSSVPVDSPADSHDVLWYKFDEAAVPVVNYGTAGVTGDLTTISSGTPYFQYGSLFGRTQGFCTGWYSPGGGGGVYGGRLVPMPLDFTATMWVLHYANLSRAAGAYTMFFGKKWLNDATFGAEPYIALSIYSDVANTGSWKAQVTTSLGGVYTRQAAVSVLLNAAGSIGWHWSFIAVTYAGSGDCTLRVYGNAELGGTGGPYAGQDAQIPSGAGPWAVGCRGANVSEPARFIVARARLRDEAVSQAWLKNVYRLAMRY